MDYSHFIQAINAILTNSLESFAGQEGRIEILAKKEHQLLIVEISDSGAGIKDEDLPFIFDPFFTTKAIGVGMGLCKAQRIIAEYHGKIHVESETGTGTKVSITIPMDR